MFATLGAGAANRNLTVGDLNVPDGDGGGPAGLHAAARLAAAGFRIALLEEHGAIGEPVHCTGIVAAGAFEEFSLSRRAALNELTVARFWSPAGRHITYAPGRVEAVVVDRRVFDQDLLATAERSGVNVHRGARVTNINVDADGVTVNATGGELHARACILPAPCSAIPRAHIPPET